MRKFKAFLKTFLTTSKPETLLAGLGNPGKKYQNTPHNAGFVALDLLVESLGVNSRAWQKRWQCLSLQGVWQKKQLLFLKPQTFMNNSGLALREVFRYYKISYQSLWIIHDDLDIPLGQIKITFDRSPAGHKGIESIIKYLKTKNFYRFRIGVGPVPEFLEPQTYLLTPLQNPALSQLKKGLEKMTQALKFSLEACPEKAMERFN